MVVKASADLPAEQPAFLADGDTERVVLWLDVDCSKPSAQYVGNFAHYFCCLGQCLCRRLVDVASHANETFAHHVEKVTQFSAPAPMDASLPVVKATVIATRKP